jgi:hypothetical protein
MAKNEHEVMRVEMKKRYMESVWTPELEHDIYGSIYSKEEVLKMIEDDVDYYLINALCLPWNKNENDDSISPS